MYRVREIMTRELVTLNEAEDLGLAESILALGRFRHLPVVGEEGRLVGLISHRDLLRVWADRGWAARAGTRAKEVMTRNPVTVTPDTPVFEAGRMLYANKFGCLPVVEKDRLVGIVTEADFLQLAVQLAETAPDPFREAHPARKGPA